MSRETLVLNENLKELRSSGYEMAKGEPDIRGWKVVNTLNQEIGKIKEVLFDVIHKKVRYIIVDLNGKPINLLSRDVVIPVGLAELDDTDNIVYLPDVTVGHLASLPEYKKGKITYQTERKIRDVFIPEDSAAADKLAAMESAEYPEREAFYNNDYYDDKRMYRRRQNDDKIKKEVYEDKVTDTKNKVYEEDVTDTKKVKNEEDVVYIPDDNDPSVLRRAKIVREVHEDRNS